MKDHETRSFSGYTHKLSRRESLKWMGALSGAVALTVTLPACNETAGRGEHAPWPELKLKPVTANGYGTDPKLISPAPAPWPRLMNSAQLALSAVLADIIVPREGAVPAASEVGVVDVIDEWISAPYPRQQSYRALIEPGLQWLDDEASRRFGRAFIKLSEHQRIEIVDDIAFADRPAPASLTQAKTFFASFRTLTVGAFFTSPEGTRDLGYEGNVVIAGDYPGPSAEAMQHLAELLDDLELEALKKTT